MVNINVSSKQREHIITYSNGTKRLARLFYSADGILCEFKKGCRTYGYAFADSNVISIEPKIKGSTDIVKQGRRFLQKVSFMLERSGLWANVKHDFELLLSLDDSVLVRILNGEMGYEERHEMARKLGLMSSSVDCGVDYLPTTIKKGIKGINYNKYSKEEESELYGNAILNKATYYKGWRKGYDNTVECKLGTDGIMRAWYSEEYKGCANGHYYLAIDNDHAIFCEDD